MMSGIDAMITDYLVTHPKAAPLHRITHEQMAKLIATGDISMQPRESATAYSGNAYVAKGYNKQSAAQKVRRQRERRRQRRRQRFNLRNAAPDQTDAAKPDDSSGKAKTSASACTPGLPSQPQAQPQSSTAPE